MISASDPVDFEPFGRRYLRSVGKEDYDNKQPGGKSEKEILKLHKNADGIEEELFAAGHFVIHSRGNPQQFVRQLSVDFEIIDVFWYSFLCDSDAFHDCLCVVGFDQMSVLLKDGQKLSVAIPFSVDSVWLTKDCLLFQRASESSDLMDVGSPTLFSLSHPLNEVLPVIQKSRRSRPTFATSTTCSIVATVSRPELVLVYNSSTGLHSICLTKNATLEDAQVAAQLLEQSLVNQSSDSLMSLPKSAAKKTPLLSRVAGGGLLSRLRETPSSRLGLHGSESNTTEGSSSGYRRSISTSTSGVKSGWSQSLSSSSHHSAGPKTSQTRLMGDSTSSPAVGSFMSPLNVSRRSSGFGATPTPRILMSNRRINPRSPSVSRLMAVKYLQSPCASPIAALSPSVGIVDNYTPMFRRHKVMFSSPTPSVASSSRNITADASRYWPSEPLLPDMSLEIIWTEAASSKHKKGAGHSDNSKASRGFVTTDFTGQQFFGFFIAEANTLHCVKLNVSNDQSRVVCGAATSMSVRDVLELKDSPVFLYLDMNYNLMVNSGITKISSVHINTMALASPQVKPVGLHPASASATDGQKGILTSSRHPSTEDAEMDIDSGTSAMLSPVLMEDSDLELTENTPQCNPFAPVISGLVRCFVGSCEMSFVIELISGGACKSALPPLASCPIVTDCLRALAAVLPQKISLSLLCRWYLHRHGGSREAPELLIFAKFICDLMGFPSSKMSFFKKHNLIGTSVAVRPIKKPKSDAEGSNQDWEYLIKSSFISKHSVTFERSLSANLNESSATELPSSSDKLSFNCAADCFQFLPTIFQCLHVVYEESKLYKSRWPQLHSFAEILYTMAASLKLDNVCDNYVRDFSDLFHSSMETVVTEDISRVSLNYPPIWPGVEQNLFCWLDKLLSESKQDPISPLLVVISVCKRTVTAAILFGIMGKRITSAQNVAGLLKDISHLSGAHSEAAEVFKTAVSCVSPLLSMPDNIKAVARGLYDTLKHLNTFPCGIAIPTLDCLSWNAALSQLFKGDLMEYFGVVRPKTTKISYTIERTTDSSFPAPPVKQPDDGMEQFESSPVLKMRFPNDRRATAVRRMLDSSKPVKISLKQQPATTDQDFREEQEKYLYSVCLRTMALPFGRGMITLKSKCPVVTELIQIPKLCLVGRAPPRSLTIELNHIEIPPNMDHWPHFHNGVAAALQIAPKPDAPIDSGWILYNLPKNKEVSPEMAGFALGLGLNGHLSSLALFNIHDYLTRCDSLTNLALLLGISCAKYGTADLDVHRALICHLAFLLPPTVIELNVKHLVQTAGIVSLGLLHAESGNRLISQSLSKELGKPPGSDPEDCLDRESYALACGLALGFINLGQGNLAASDGQSSLTDQLIRYMTGGPLRSNLLLSTAPLFKPESYDESYGLNAKELSQQIKEDDIVNLDVTCPAATLALGMMYLKTGNKAVASWLNPPTTLALLDSVRPDFILLRVLSKNLVLFDEILPTREWVDAQIPVSVRRITAISGEDGDILLSNPHFTDDFSSFPFDVDMETVAQSYCNVVIGACMAIALKFAGSANAAAFRTLNHYCKIFQPDGSPGVEAFLHHAGRWTTELGLNMLVLCLGVVMAGTGNLEVVRLIRYLRKRTASMSSTGAYGSHMALHMALGFLFIGEGRYSLGTNNKAIAALLCALYPKLPVHTYDNKYHLQALRHLYVLAAEPRLILPRDGLLPSPGYAYCTIKIRRKKEPSAAEGYSYKVRVPELIPELSTLDEIAVDDVRYAPVTFNRIKNNFNALQSILQTDGVLPVRRRAGYLPYDEDPHGYKSVASTFGFQQGLEWTVVNSRDEHRDRQPAATSSGRAMEVMTYQMQIFSSLMRHVTVIERTETLPFLVDLWKLCSMSTMSTQSVWQLKLIKSFKKIEFDFDNASAVDREFLVTVDQSVTAIVSNELNSSVLKLYIGKWDSFGDYNCRFLGEFLTHFDVMPKSSWDSLKMRDYRNLRLFVEKLIGRLPIRTVVTLHRILSR